jgi:hypothetical protein
MPRDRVRPNLYVTTTIAPVRYCWCHILISTFGEQSSSSHTAHGKVISIQDINCLANIRPATASLLILCTFRFVGSPTYQDNGKSMFGDYGWQAGKRLAVHTVEH